MLEKLEVHAGTCTRPAHIRGAPLHCLLGPGKNNQKFSKLGYRRGERVVKVGWRAVHFLNSPAGVAALPALPIGANVDVEAARGRGGTSDYLVVDALQYTVCFKRKHTFW